MVFIDESGFMLQPLRRRVWAERGQTPVQYAWDRRERITAIAALTRAPRLRRLGLYYDLLPHNVHTEDVVRFVRRVHQQLRRPLLLVCDRYMVHRAAVRQLHAADCSWLFVEWLPAYAPDLDPVESVWNQSKYGDLANWLANDIMDLGLTLNQLLEEYRHDPARLQSFSEAVNLPT